MLKVLELFGGIGACSRALDNLGIPYELADYVDNDKYAVKSFNAIHHTDYNPQDIRLWDKSLEVDLIMHGSPCQDFSIAGKQKGGDEDSGTRSSLMYETIRIVEKIRPKYVIWENVRNLLGDKHIHNFRAYLAKMEELGYTNYYKVLNAKDYGVPQHRERIFTVSTLGGSFTFPVSSSTIVLNDILEDADPRFYCTESQINTMKKPLKHYDYVGRECVRLGGLYDGATKHQAGSIYDPRGLSPTLSTMQGGNQEPIILADKLRRLTPHECWRLMGFDDEAFAAAQSVCSNSQLYKQAGNSIVVPVLEAILKELLHAD